MALIGRERIFREIAETADSLNRDGFVMSPGILLHGPTGYGKTALVDNAANYCSEKGFPSVTIDFTGNGRVRSDSSLLKGYVERSNVAGEHRYWGEGGKSRLMGDIMGGLVVSADAPAGKPIYENPGKWDADSAAAALIEYTK